MNETKLSVIDRIQAMENKFEFLKQDLEKENEKLREELTIYQRASKKYFNSIISSHIEENIEKIKERVRTKIEEDINFARNNLEETAKQIFENSGYIKGLREQLIRVIEQQVSVEVKNADAHKIVGELIRNYTDENIKEVVKMTANTVILSINKKLTKDYRTTKELCYSIDSEIKHLLMKTPVSKNSEEIIMKKFNKIANSVSEKVTKKLSLEE